MRLFYSVALASIITFSMATDADAGRRGGSKSEGLLFVAKTQFPADGGGTLSLCTLTETRSAFFIPFWTSAKSYALAANGCNAEQYFPVEAATLAQMSAEGLIAQSVPAEPELTTGQFVSGAWGMGLAGAGLIFAGIAGWKKSKRKQARQSAMGNASPEAVAILDVLCHAAKADGVVDDGEVQMIAAIAEKMTGTNFDLVTVQQMIELSEAKLQASEFKSLTKNLGERGRSLAMQGALQVAAADGVLAGEEKQFIGGLAQALKMGDEEIGGYLSAMSGAPA